MYENHTVVSISTKSHCHPFPTECKNCGSCDSKDSDSKKSNLRRANVRRSSSTGSSHHQKSQNTENDSEPKFESDLFVQKDLQARKSMQKEKFESILKPTVNTHNKTEINFNDIKNKSKSKRTLSIFADETVIKNTVENSRTSQRARLARSGSTIGRLGARPVQQ